MRVGKHLQVKTKLSSVSNYSCAVYHWIIGTHNIQDVISSIDVDNFCFQFQYVNGSTASKTHLQFVSANGNNDFINFTYNGQLDKLKCIMLPANNWTLYACDELPCILNPAVTITDIIVHIAPSSILLMSLSNMPSNSAISKNGKFNM